MVPVRFFYLIFNRASVLKRCLLGLWSIPHVRTKSSVEAAFCLHTETTFGRGVTLGVTCAGGPWGGHLGAGLNMFYCVRR